MPNKHFYFALGASHAAVVVAVVGAKRRAWFERSAWIRRLYRWNENWFLYFPGVIGAWGCIGLIPDALYALNLLPKQIVRGPVFNVFYGYSWFEYMEDRNETLDWWLNSLGSALLFGIALGTLVFYVRILRKLWPASSGALSKNGPAT